MIPQSLKRLVENNIVNKFNNKITNIDRSNNNNSLSKLVLEGLKNLEAGLKIIGENLDFNGVKIPLLGIDAVGRLVILEIHDKEEELILLKIIDNFDWIFNHMEALHKKFSDIDIDISLSPRIIVILPQFSEEFLRRITYFSRIDLQLYIYRMVNHALAQASEKVTFELVSFSSRRKFTKNLEEKTVDELLDYIEISSVKLLCQEALEEIKRLFPQANLSTSGGYISFQNKEKELFGIYPRRNFFWFNASRNAWRGVYVNTPAVLEDILKEIKHKD